MAVPWILIWDGAQQAVVSPQTDSVGSRIVANRFTRKRWCELLAELSREQQSVFCTATAVSKRKYKLPDDDEAIILLLLA